MTHEAAGLFSSVAERERIPFEIVDLHQGEKIPRVGLRDTVVILGGPDSANDETPKILSEIEAIQDCLRKGVPVLGVCLGLQLLVKAAGGTVFRNAFKEVGFRGPGGHWFQVEKNQEGQMDPLLIGTPDTFRIFQLHGEAVGLASSMVCLARGQFCENQIVRIQERAYGIQGHVELSLKMFEDWLAEDEDLRKMEAGQLRKDFNEVFAELRERSEVIFKNFLKISGFLS